MIHLNLESLRKPIDFMEMINFSIFQIIRLLSVSIELETFSSHQFAPAFEDY
jgi:hypothetical protein